MSGLLLDIILHVNLVYWMGKFVLEVCKKDGSTHRNLCMLWFVASNAFLSKMVSIMSTLAEPITPDEESLLWTNGQLGTHSAKALLNTIYVYNCKVFGLRSYDEHRNLRCAQFEKKLDEKGRVYVEYTDFGSKTNCGGLKHMKVQNKTIRQYENPSDADHCLVNIFVKYVYFIPSRDGHFYFWPLPNDGSGIPRFGKQAVGRNTLAQLIPEMCKVRR